MTDWQTHPEYLALLETVLTNPEDNAPRWIISDWLEEHDQIEYAHFIRAQLEVHSILEKMYSQWIEERNLDFDLEENRDAFESHLSNKRMEDGYLMSAEGALITELYQQIRELRKSYPAPNHIEHIYFFSHAKFEKLALLQTLSNEQRHSMALVDRGLICEISMTCDEFIKHAASLFQSHPITRAWLTDKDTCYNNNLPQSETHRAMWRIGDPDAMNDPKSWLPPEIGLKLPTQLYEWNVSAIRALSLACVDYGRELVGLPPIKSH